MKNLNAVVAAGLLAIGGSAAAGTHPTGLNIRKAETNYLACLGSCCDGVRESALAQVVRMRLAYPEAPLTCITERVAQMAAAGRTPEIRMKARLASAVLANPRLLKAVSIDPETDVFSLIRERLAADVPAGYSEAR
ncbi:MAG: hypothetical protein WB626_04020 [Bacteroidota bacterium]